MRKLILAALAVSASAMAMPAAAQDEVNFDSGAPLASYAGSDGLVFSNFDLRNDTFGGAVNVPSNPFYINLNAPNGSISFVDPTTGRATTSNGFGLTVAGLNGPGGFYAGATLTFLGAAGDVLGSQSFAPVGPNENRGVIPYFTFANPIKTVTFEYLPNPSGSALFPIDNVRFDLNAVTGAVPEPATWAMMIGGFGMVGGAMRSARRKQKVSVTFA